MIFKIRGISWLTLATSLAKWLSSYCIKHAIIYFFLFPSKSALHLRHRAHRSMPHNVHSHILNSNKQSYNTTHEAYPTQITPTDQNNSLWLHLHLTTEFSISIFRCYIRNMTVSVQFGLVYKEKSIKNKTLTVQAGIIDITLCWV